MNRRSFTASIAAAGMAPLRAAKANWRLATGYRAESFHTVNVAAMASEVAQATQGGFGIEVHATNALVTLAEVRAAYNATTARIAALLGAQGVDVPMVEVGTEIKRLGERFSLEWLRQVGPEANEIFVPYFTQG
ncbi:MAG TPA: hypothetical protein VGE16_12475 [Albitalea sp.]